MLRPKEVVCKWVEKKLSNPNAELMQAFGHDEKKIRDYIKKMMGRITFLHFLQRKGWMCGDLNYMQNLFERSWYKNDYLDAVLEPLFFGILNTKSAEREALFSEYGWDKDLLEEWKDIPYLNGGLFERDEEDEPESVFPAEYFQRLFQFFSEYNFTIDENDPNDALGNIRYYDNETDNYTQHHLQLNYTRQFSERLLWSSTFNYTRGDGYFESYKPQGASGDYGFEDVFSGDFIVQEALANDYFVFNSDVRYKARFCKCFKK